MRACVSFLLTLILLIFAINLHAQGTAFTYQGRLYDGGNPANGDYDLQFALYDASTNGNQVGSAMTNAATAVTNGLFTVTLDFGGVFNGSNYWLQIAARTNGGSAFTTLSPLQALTPVPYAVYAQTSGVAVSAGSFTGGGQFTPLSTNNPSNFGLVLNNVTPAVTNAFLPANGALYGALVGSTAEATNVEDLSDDYLKSVSTRYGQQNPTPLRGYILWGDAPNFGCDFQQLSNTVQIAEANGMWTNGFNNIFVGPNSFFPRGTNWTQPLMWDTNKFPGGGVAVANYVHSKGGKVFVYHAFGGVGTNGLDFCNNSDYITPYTAYADTVGDITNLMDGGMYDHCDADDQYVTPDFIRAVLRTVGNAILTYNGAPAVSTPFRPFALNLVAIDGGNFEYDIGLPYSGNPYPNNLNYSMQGANSSEFAAQGIDYPSLTNLNFKMDYAYPFANQIRPGVSIGIGGWWDAFVGSSITDTNYVKADIAIDALWSSQSWVGSNAPAVLYNNQDIKSAWDDPAWNPPVNITNDVPNISGYNGRIMGLSVWQKNLSPLDGDLTRQRVYVVVVNNHTFATNCLISLTQIESYAGSAANLVYIRDIWAQTNFDTQGSAYNVTVGAQTAEPLMISWYPATTAGQTLGWNGLNFILSSPYADITNEQILTPSAIVNQVISDGATNVVNFMPSSSGESLESTNNAQFLGFYANDGLGGSTTASLSTNGLHLGTNGEVTWSGTAAGTATPVTSLSSPAAGVVAVGTGSNNSSNGTLQAAAVVAGSASAATGFVINSNAWNITTYTNGMANFASSIVSSNGTPVVIYLSNGVPYIYYLNSSGGGIIP
jgi:hypothetical protein